MSNLGHGIADIANTGLISFVATPIGNLGDVTLRALEVLRCANVVLAEDTRVAGKLLAALGIEGVRVERLDEHLLSDPVRIKTVIERALSGEKIAYTTDAGMPGVSDPGMRLLAAARSAGVRVEVLPGASAATTAFVASGTVATSFYFGGFLPRKDKARTDLLQQLRKLDAALVFYESPYRVASSLACIAHIFPQREVSVCRELTKLHEEVVRGESTHIAEEFQARETVKGEIVIVIDPPNVAERESGRIDGLQTASDRAHALAAVGERPKTIAKQLGTELGIARNEAYSIALEAVRVERSR